MIKLIPLILIASCSTNDLTGTWTGKLDSYLSTFQLKNDGTGRFCYSKGNMTKIENVTYGSGLIHSKRGEVKYSAVQYAREGVRGEVTNFVVEGDKFYIDNDLFLASAYCRKLLKG